MARTYEIAAYMYQADFYCDTCIARIAADHARPDAIVVPILHNTETLLDEWAARAGISRHEEETFDSDDFPKVVFGSDIEHETCGECGDAL